MPNYTLNIRRFSPESGEPAYFGTFDVEMEGHRPVLDAILEARAATRTARSESAVHVRQRSAVPAACASTATRRSPATHFCATPSPLPKTA